MSRPARHQLAPLLAFVTVAELGGFTAAARALGVTKSSISRTVRTLEDELGARLLLRHPRRVRPTAAGRRLLASAQPALRMIGRALAEVALDRASPGDPAPAIAPRQTV